MEKITRFIKAHKILSAAGGAAIVVVLIMIIASTAPSSITKSYSKEKKEMLTCVNQTLDAIYSADSSYVLEHLSKKAAGTIGYSYMNPTLYKEALITEAGITEDNLYEPTNEALDAFILAASNRLVEEKSVSGPENISEKKNAVTGQLEVSFKGISDYNAIGFSDTVNTANEELVTYINSNMDNLMTNLEAQGSDNLKIALVNHSLITLFNGATTGLDTLPVVDKSFIFTVSVTKDKNGRLKSKITSISDNK